MVAYFYKLNRGPLGPLFVLNLLFYDSTHLPVAALVVSTWKTIVKVFAEALVVLEADPVLSHLVPNASNADSTVPASVVLTVTS